MKPYMGLRNTYEVVGTSDGIYDLTLTEVGEKTTTFTVTRVPTSNRAVHEYTVNWEALNTKGTGVVLRVDPTGNGVFEAAKTLQSPVASFFYAPVRTISFETLIMKAKSIVSLGPSGVHALTNQAIRFDASNSYDPDGEIAQYKWSFGDGNTSAGRMVNRAYPTPGYYLVSLVVVNSDGVVSTHEEIIRIGEAPHLPIWLWLVILTAAISLLAIIARAIRWMIRS